jgi:hypothetical protein
MIDRPVHQKRCGLPPGEPECPVLDRWVREDLRRQFGKTKDEPLPAEWLDLLNEA